MINKAPYEIKEKLTIKEAASALGVHPATIRRKIKRNKIKWEKDEGERGRYFIPTSEIDAYRTARAVVSRVRETELAGITNEMYEQRVAVIKLYDRISEIQASEIAIAEYIQDITAKLDKLTAKIDELTSKLVPLEEEPLGTVEPFSSLELEPLDEDAPSTEKVFSQSESGHANLAEFFTPIQTKPAQVKYKERWWQFWRPEKP